MISRRWERRYVEDMVHLVSARKSDALDQQGVVFELVEASAWVVVAISRLQFRWALVGSDPHHWRCFVSVSFGFFGRRRRALCRRCRRRRRCCCRRRGDRR